MRLYQDNVCLHRTSLRFDVYSVAVWFSVLTLFAHKSAEFAEELKTAVKIINATATATPVRPKPFPERYMFVSYYLVNHGSNNPILTPTLSIIVCSLPDQI